MCFISDLIQIAYHQENVVGGYVEDTSDEVIAADLFADVVEDLVMSSFEMVEPLPKVQIKHQFPLHNDIVRDVDGDWLVISGSVYLTEPTIVRARKLSDKNPHNKSDLARPYQIRMFNVVDLVRQDNGRASYAVRPTESLPPNEVALGSYDHITEPVTVEYIPVQPQYQDTYVNPEWRAYFVDGEIVYKDGDGVPPMDVEVRRATSHNKRKGEWANPTGKPFRFQDCPWYKDITR